MSTQLYAWCLLSELSSKSGMNSILFPVLGFCGDFFPDAVLCFVFVFCTFFSFFAVSWCCFALPVQCRITYLTTTRGGAGGSGPLRGTGIWKFPTGERANGEKTGGEMSVVRTGRYCFSRTRPHSATKAQLNVEHLLRVLKLPLKSIVDDAL